MLFCEAFSFRTKDGSTFELLLAFLKVLSKIMDRSFVNKSISLLLRAGFVP
jgi:hypothetical protein